MCGYCFEETMLQTLADARSEGRKLGAGETQTITPGAVLDLLIQEGDSLDKFELLLSSNQYNALTFACRSAAEGRSCSRPPDNALDRAKTRFDTFFRTVETLKNQYSVIEDGYEWSRYLDQEIAELFEALHVITAHATVKLQLHVLLHIVRLEWFPLTPSAFGHELWLQRRAVLACLDCGALEELLSDPPIRPALMAYLLLRRRLSEGEHRQVVSKLESIQATAAGKDISNFVANYDL